MGRGKRLLAGALAAQDGAGTESGAGGWEEKT